MNCDLCTALSEEAAKLRSVPGTPDADVFRLVGASVKRVAEESGAQHACAQ